MSQFWHYQKNIICFINYLNWVTGKHHLCHNNLCKQLLSNCIIVIICLRKTLSSVHSGQMNIEYCMYSSDDNFQDTAYILGIQSVPTPKPWFTNILYISRCWLISIFQHGECQKQFPVACCSHHGGQISDRRLHTHIDISTTLLWGNHAGIRKLDIVLLSVIFRSLCLRYTTSLKGPCNR